MWLHPGLRRNLAWFLAFSLLVAVSGIGDHASIGLEIEIQLHFVGRVFKYAGETSGGLEPRVFISEMFFLAVDRLVFLIIYCLNKCAQSRGRLVVKIVQRRRGAGQRGSRYHPRRVLEGFRLLGARGGATVTCHLLL